MRATLFIKVRQNFTYLRRTTTIILYIIVVVVIHYILLNKVFAPLPLRYTRTVADTKGRPEDR